MQMLQCMHGTCKRSAGVTQPIFICLHYAHNSGNLNMPILLLILGVASPEFKLLLL